MSATGLFAIGVPVTLIVVAGMTLPVYAAILDGRDAAARKAAGRHRHVPARGTRDARRRCQLPPRPGGRMTAADIAGRIYAETLQGGDVAISNNGAVRIDGARLVSGDIEASNGVIHVIDRVLLPART